MKECPKLHLTTGLHKGHVANKNALSLGESTLAFLFRKSPTLNEISGREGIEHVKIEPPFLIRDQLTEIYSELYKK